MSSAPQFSCRIANERGFFTVAGLCLLLALAICIRGVQEFEGNYSVGATSFQAEHELQNYADTALILAIETNDRNFTFHSERLGAVTVKVYSRNENIRQFERRHNSGSISDIALKDSDDNDLAYENCKIFISVASCDSGFIGGKIYRRALAYILDGDKTLHFLTDL